MRLIMLGAPGAGKGTQAKAIVDRYQVDDIATGDLLRAEVAAGTEVGKRAKAIMEAGELVPDEIVLHLIEEHLANDDISNGFLLDGFPRNLHQAADLDALLARILQPLDLALFLDVGYDEIRHRLLQRHRTDDTHDVITHRLEVYESQTLPLVDYYESRGILHQVAGVGEIHHISEGIFGILDRFA
jgi:adenylate kinase